MVRLRWVATAIAITLLLLPPASGQANAVYRLTLEGAPAAPVEVTGAHQQGLVVKLVVQNVLCAGNANFVAALTAQAVPKPAGNASNSSANATPSKSLITLTIGQGAHVSPTEKSDTFQVTTAPGGNVTAPQEFTVTVSASIPANSGSECREASASSRTPINAQPLSYTVRFLPTNLPPASEGPKLPVPPEAVFLALALGALAFRRRSRSA